jgi:hypothetical protein
MQARGALDFAIRMQWLALAADWRAFAESAERVASMDGVNVRDARRHLISDCVCLTTGTVYG